MLILILIVYTVDLFASTRSEDHHRALTEKQD